jgi:hypothetical protein
LFFPSTAFWWFNKYPEFRAYLDAHFHRLWGDQRCIIYQLWEGPRLRFTAEPRPLSEAARQAGPVGVGGIDRHAVGTVATILLELEFYLGSELNTANDNLLVAYLFRGLHKELGNAKKAAARGFEVLKKLMIGDANLTPEEIEFFHGRLTEWVETPEDAREMVDRLVYQSRHIDYSPYQGWGWKAPAGYYLQPALKESFPTLKYIYTIRHGLDTAFGTDQDQIRRWNESLGTPLPEAPEQLPKAALDYWIKINEKSVSVGQSLLGERFLVVNYDDLCKEPKTGLTRLMEFLQVKCKMGTIERLSSLVQKPADLGVYHSHNLGIFSTEELDAVRKLGFPVGPK